MARKFGKKNQVKSNILSHNLMLIGESGIGKTTVIKEMCELLGGEDSYIFLEFGKEDGSDEIEGIVAEPVWDWEKFVEVTDDIIENRNTDYKDLQVVVLDTIDELFAITEPQVIKIWNRELPSDKPKVKSFKATYGGFNGPTDKAIELVFDKLWELKRCGISFISIGHTKKKDVVDPVTEESYSTLTTNMDTRYFNAMKTKVAALGVAYVDREILKYKTGRKNTVTNKEEVKGKVTSESRVICFRDDNFSVDSKSRFSEIVDKIPLDAHALIKALQDAIVAEQAKSGKSPDEIAKEQKIIEAEDRKIFDERLEMAKTKHHREELESHRDEWLTNIRAAMTDCDPKMKSEIKSMMNGVKLSDPSFSIETLEKIKNMLNL